MVCVMVKAWIGICLTLGFRSRTGESVDAIAAVWGDGGTDVGVVGVDVSFDPDPGDGDGVGMSDSEELTDGSAVVELGFGLCGLKVV